MFFNGHKQKDIKEYWEIFLHEIKLFLLYFVEFSKNSAIVSKEYLNDCVIRESEKRPINLIIHNESIFLANDNSKKVWILNG